MASFLIKKIYSCAYSVLRPYILILRDLEFLCCSRTIAHTYFVGIAGERDGVYPSFSHRILSLVRHPHGNVYGPPLRFFSVVSAVPARHRPTRSRLANIRPAGMMIYYIPPPMSSIYLMLSFLELKRSGLPRKILLFDRLFLS